MAEVLITLGIIGIVAAMTLPTLIAKYQDKQFKTAYKKVYTELSQVVQDALFNQEFERSRLYDPNATKIEMDVIKRNFKVVKECPKNSDIYQCWAKGDTLCGGGCSGGEGIDLENGHPMLGESDCFVDAAGRSWCSYYFESNIFTVDTNGLSKPNRFGKDRWVFAFGDENGSYTNDTNFYKKIIPFNEDTTTQTSFCKHPPCYYHSWLYD